jgi:hypothetical protein
MVERQPTLLVVLVQLTRVVAVAAVEIAPLEHRVALAVLV